MTLQEKYRPTSFAEMVGQDKATKQIQFIIRNGPGTKVIWLQGRSGCGKTTYARIIAAIHGGLVTEYGSAERFRQADVDELIRALTMKCLVHRTWIINEAHCLANKIFKQLLGAIEGLPAWACIIFTTTNMGEEVLFDGINDHEHTAWFRRAARVKLVERLDTGSLIDVYARRVQEIAIAEGIDGRPIEDYRKLVSACDKSLGLALAELDNGWSIK